MPKSKTKRRRAWTAAETRTLKADAKKKLARVIARKLKRSEGATRQKAFSMGISLAHPAAWSAARRKPVMGRPKYARAA